MGFAAIRMGHSPVSGTSALSTISGQKLGTFLIGRLQQARKSSQACWENRNRLPQPAPAPRDIEAHDRLSRRYERKPPGYRAAQRAKNDALNKQCEILETIRNTRAQSVVGLVAKARVARDDDMDEPMGLSLVEDLCALGEAATG
jgi:hypothetical protein